MIGTIYLFPNHKGTLFTVGSSSYALLNGQLLSRSTYVDLSSVWPQGAYGSTVNTIVLPDLSGGQYLRGHAFQTGRDPAIGSRTTPSGSLPTAPSGIGTFQTAQMLSHTHPSGFQEQTFPTGNSGGDGNPSWPVLGTFNSNVPSLIQSATLGPASSDAVEFSHLKAYPYMRIS
jgi:hypothetical protein